MVHRNYVRVYGAYRVDFCRTWGRNLKMKIFEKVIREKEFKSDWWKEKGPFFFYLVGG